MRTCEEKAATRKGVLARPTLPCDTLIYNLQPPELGEVNVCCLFKKQTKLIPRSYPIPIKSDFLGLGTGQKYLKAPQAILVCNQQKTTQSK